MYLSYVHSLQSLSPARTRLINIISLDRQEVFLPENIAVLVVVFYCLQIQQTCVEHLLLTWLYAGFFHVLPSPLIPVSIWGSRSSSFLQVRMERFRTSAPFCCSELWEYQERPMRRTDFVL